MAVKERLKAAAEWGKKNPVIVLLLFAGIVWLLIRRPAAAPEELAPLPGLPDAIQGQAFPQVGALPPRQEAAIDRAAPVDPTIIFIGADMADRHRPGDVVHTPAPGRVLDYRVVGRDVYRERIAEAHRAWVPGVPDRPVADGRILTAERGWETPQAVIARQRVRFDRAVARGDAAAAEMVRRETELATGVRTGW